MDSPAHHFPWAALGPASASQVGSRVRSHFLGHCNHLFRRCGLLDGQKRRSSMACLSPRGWAWHRRFERFCCQPISANHPGEPWSTWPRSRGAYASTAEHIQLSSQGSGGRFKSERSRRVCPIRR